MKKNTYLLSAIIVLLVIIIISLLAHIYYKDDVSSENDNNNNKIEEKTPLQLMEEEKNKLRDALADIGYDSGNERMVYDYYLGPVYYVFSFNSYSFSEQYSNNGINIYMNYDLITDTASGNMTSENQVVQFTYDFNSNSGSCQATTLLGQQSCTYYSELPALKSTFMKIIKEHDIDLDVMLNNN